MIVKQHIPSTRSRNFFLISEINSKYFFEETKITSARCSWPDGYVTTGKELFAVGEYWAPGYLHLLLRYIEATEGHMSVFDSSLHHNLHNASKAGKNYDL